jgi:hypothetical protein
LAEERREEKRRDRTERRRERRDGANMWVRRHVVATSAKPPCKTAGGPKVNVF